MAAAQKVSQQLAAGRHVKVYLGVWGMLGLCGLAYLGSLAWQPELLGTSASQSQQAAPVDHGLRAANRALAELVTVRRSVSDLQKDVGQIRDQSELREARDRELHSRVAAIEERVATPPMAAAPEAPGAAPSERMAAKAKTETARKSARIIQVPEGTPAAPPAKAETPGIETGSIAGQPQPVVTFGAPVVTPTARRPFAVQLAAGPSLDALRLSWSLLQEKHAALAGLEPRYVPPRTDGTGPYRLVAGPFNSKAEADKACADMGVGNKGCFSLPFIGQPL